MKYDMLAVIRQAKRRRVRALALAEGGKKMREIGEILGVTKQRASELVARARQEAGR